MTRIPSAFARSTTRSPATTESSVEAPELRRLNSSLTAKAKCASLSDVVAKRS